MFMDTKNADILIFYIMLFYYYFIIKPGQTYEIHG